MGSNKRRAPLVNVNFHEISGKLIGIPVGSSNQVMQGIAFLVTSSPKMQHVRLTTVPKGTIEDIPWSVLKGWLSAGTVVLLKEAPASFI